MAEVNGWRLEFRPRLARHPLAPQLARWALEAAEALPPGPGPVEVEALSPVMEVLSLTRFGRCRMSHGIPLVEVRARVVGVAPQPTFMHELSHALFLLKMAPPTRYRMVEEGLCDLLVMAGAKPEWLKSWRPWWLRVPRTVRPYEAWVRSLPLAQSEAKAVLQFQGTTQAALDQWELWASEYLPPPPEPPPESKDAPPPEAPEPIRSQDLPSSPSPRSRWGFLRGRSRGEGASTPSASPPTPRSPS